ncbi:hypothetical protein [Elongatibacter sediminis]|uniref:Nucleotidyltransferase n=1 Tax=Elongatibacter sediminis TaxID=3119006 RepID=A0AAW9RKE9_9GAMM
MPRQRKTRTKSSDSLAPRQNRGFSQIRREIAAEAARIIATEGQPNYHMAKKKAAERVGVSERLALPSNLEVQDALLMYQGLYGGSAHADNLDRLRGAAVEAMRRLEVFSPRLVGPVLDGTAGPHSRVSLHVFCDAPENLVLYFLEAGVSFVQEQRRIRWHDSGYRTMQVLVVEVDGTTVELLVFQPVDLRQAPPSPIDGKPQRRAGLTEVECLLNPVAEARHGS